MAFDMGIKAQRSSSETAVKVGSRATFPSQAANVLVYQHTHLCCAHIHHHMRIHPPDLPALFPSSGRLGESFLAMCCFLASERLYSFLLEGAVLVSPSHLAPPVSFWMYLFSSFPPPSSLLSLCLSLPPSATLPELTFAVRQPYYFVPQIPDQDSVFPCLSPHLSSPLFVFFLLPSPTHNSSPVMVPFLLVPLLFFSFFAASIEHNLIQSISRIPPSITPFSSLTVSRCLVQCF